jgi:hypothetical protein
MSDAVRYVLRGHVYNLANAIAGASCCWSFRRVSSNLHLRHACVQITAASAIFGFSAIASHDGKTASGDSSASS